MFSLEHLHVLRAAELEAIIAHLKPEARILEFGAGTGAQALALAQRGFDVSAVDVQQSNYSEHRVFDVIDYDGRHLPFPNATFDVVYSSNVLEHIADLAPVHREIRRVLKQDGYCVHVLPSTAWRFWTSVSAFPEMARSVGRMLPQLKPQGLTRNELQRLAGVWTQAAREFLRPFVPVRHGETGNALTELWTFSRTHWVRQFKRNGFDLEIVRPMGLFYTGYMYFGSAWDLETRQRLAKRLGSACNIYVMEPRGFGSRGVNRKQPERERSGRDRSR